MAARSGGTGRDGVPSSRRTRMPTGGVIARPLRIAVPAWFPGLVHGRSSKPVFARSTDTSRRDRLQTSRSRGRHAAPHPRAGGPRIVARRHRAVPPLRLGRGWTRTSVARPGGRELGELVFTSDRTRHCVTLIVVVFVTTLDEVPVHVVSVWVPTAVAAENRHPSEREDVPSAPGTARASRCRRRCCRRDRPVEVVGLDARLTVPQGRRSVSAVGRASSAGEPSSMRRRHPTISDATATWGGRVARMPLG